MSYVEFSSEQERRIDEVYDLTLEYCQKLTRCDWLRDGDADAGEVPFIVDIADAAAEILTKHGWKVYFPTHVQDPSGDYICDAYPAR